MRSYKNNNKRKFRINGDRNSTRGHDPQTLISNTNFQRKNHRNNNHNAARLVEKYSSLAREALSSGDKILSENYFQHADHFTRIMNEQDVLKKAKLVEINNLNKENSSDKEKKNDLSSENKISDPK